MTEPNHKMYEEINNFFILGLQHSAKRTDTIKFSLYQSEETLRLCKLQTEKVCITVISTLTGLLFKALYLNLL